MSIASVESYDKFHDTYSLLNAVTMFRSERLMFKGALTCRRHLRTNADILGMDAITKLRFGIDDGELQCYSSMCVPQGLLPVLVADFSPLSTELWAWRGTLCTR